MNKAHVDGRDVSNIKDILCTMEKSDGAVCAVCNYKEINNLF